MDANDGDTDDNAFGDEDDIGETAGCGTDERRCRRLDGDGENEGGGEAGNVIRGEDR